MNEKILSSDQIIQVTGFSTNLAEIVSGASYLPSSVVKNADIVADQANVFDVLVRRAIGANERRAASPGETNAEMMAIVARKIMADSGVPISRVSKIICSADPQDMVAPSVASIVQSKIGASCPAFDVQMSCAGWICGLDIAVRSFGVGDAPSYVLVLASSTVGSRLNFFNRRDRAIFGDGASGVLVGSSGVSHSRLMCTQLWTDGRFHTDITAPLPWTVRPPVVPEEYEGSFYMSPDQDVFLSSLTRVLPPFIDKLLNKSGASIASIDHFLLHQPSMPLFNHSLSLLPTVPREKVIDLFSKYGNLIAAEMPLYFAHGVQSGEIKKGDRVLMFTYGAGFTMAGCIFDY